MEITGPPYASTNSTMVLLDIDDDEDEDEDGEMTWMPIAIPSCGFDFPMGMRDAYNLKGL